MMPPFSGSPAAPFTLNDVVRLSPYLATTDWSNYVSHQPSPGEFQPGLALNRGGFKPRGQSRLLPRSRRMTEVATAGQARSEQPWARQGRGGTSWLSAPFLVPLPEVVP